MIWSKISQLVTYKEPLLLFQNQGQAFKNVSNESGPVFAKRFSARGLAVGDFNNDGAVDVLISNNDDAPVLLRNNAARQNHWLGVHLVGRKCNPDAIGARLTYQAADLKRERMKVGGGSFLSSHDPRMVLGVGKRSRIDWLEVKWPQQAARWSVSIIFLSTGISPLLKELVSGSDALAPSGHLDPSFDN